MIVFDLYGDDTFRRTFRHPNDAAFTDNIVDSQLFYYYEMYSRNLIQTCLCLFHESICAEI